MMVNDLYLINDILRCMSHRGMSLKGAYFYLNALHYILNEQKNNKYHKPME